MQCLFRKEETALIQQNSEILHQGIECQKHKTTNPTENHGIGFRINPTRSLDEDFWTQERALRGQQLDKERVGYLDKVGFRFASGKSGRRRGRGHEPSRGRQCRKGRRRQCGTVFLRPRSAGTPAEGPRQRRRGRSRMRSDAHWLSGSASADGVAFVCLRDQQLRGVGDQEG